MKGKWAELTPDGYLRVMCPNCNIAFSKNLDETLAKDTQLFCPSCGMKITFEIPGKKGS